MNLVKENRRLHTAIKQLEFKLNCLVGGEEGGESEIYELPQHRLRLKAGCTVILLRNLCSKRGLCNGVRLNILSLHNAVIHCEILTGSHLGHQVLIPKLKLAPSDANLPFVF